MLLEKRKIVFTNSRNSQINIPYKLAIDLENTIKQLDSLNRDHYIKDIDFYKGDEPNYGIIKKGS